MTSSEQLDKIANYKVFNVVGQGGFGNVYRAYSIKNEKEVAIKIIEKKKMHDQQMIRRVKSEVEIHSRLKHPHVLEVLSFFDDEHFVYLVLELCHNGDLNSYLKEHLKLNEDEACYFLRQIVEGMLYLHKHKILHRDLKLSNILLTKDMTVKVADFGVATQLESSDDKHFTMCGTPNYLAPEVIMKGPYGLEADIWSIGCMLYGLLVGQPPFNASEVKNTLNRIVSAGYLLPEELSDEAKDLIGLLLQKEGKNRIALDKILEHPLFTKRPSTSFFSGAVDETSADSGRDTLGTTSGELMTGSNQSHSISSSDSNSHCPPLTYSPSPFHLAQSSHKTDENKVQSLPLTSSSTGQHLMDQCHVQPPVSFQHLQLVTPLRKRSGSAQNLQRQDSSSQQKAQQLQFNDGYFCNSVGRCSVPAQPFCGHRNSVDCQNPAALCQKQNESCSNSTKSFTNQISWNPVEHDSNKVTTSQDVAVSGSNLVMPCSKPKPAKELNHWFPTNRQLKQNLRTYDPKLYQHNSRTGNASDQDYLSRRLEQDFDEDERLRRTESPSSSEGSLQDQFVIDWNTLRGRFSDQNLEAEERWDAHIANDGCFDRDGMCLHHHQSESNLFQTDRLRGQPQSSRKLLGFHSPLTVRSAMTLQRTHQRHQKQPHSCVRSRSVENLNQLDGGHSGRWSAVSIEMDSRPRQQKQFRVPPICAVRLRPITEKTKNAVAHILESGDVYLEFFKTLNNTERVFEAIRISPDGQTIETYLMNGTLDPCLKPYPHSTSSQKFGYSTLPKKYWKKYEYASHFVTAVRSKTVKLTLYSDRGKGVLMENSPNQDFEVYFYSGAKFKVRSGSTKIIQADGTSMMLESSSSFNHLSQETQDMWQHVQELHALCKELDAFFTERFSQKLPCFPIVIGRKPSTAAFVRTAEHRDIIQTKPFISGNFSSTERVLPSNCSGPVPQQLNSSGNVRRSSLKMSVTEQKQEAFVRSQPICFQSMNVIPVYHEAKSPLPPATPNRNASQVVKQIYEPSIGTAFEYSKGLVVIRFNNGSEVQLDREGSRILLKDNNGQLTVLTENDKLPDEILPELRSMLGRLGICVNE